MSHYTSPEANTERRICGRIRARILKDACAVCVHRVQGWGKSACTLVGRTYPACGSDGRALRFTPDHTAIDLMMRAAA